MPEGEIEYSHHLILMSVNSVVFAVIGDMKDDIRLWLNCTGNSTIQMYSHISWAEHVCICVCLRVCSQCPVCSLSHFQCPQTAINYCFISSYPTTTVPLFNTGCIIIEPSNTNDNGDNSNNENNKSSCNFRELGVILPPPSASHLSAEEVSTECTKTLQGQTTKKNKKQNKP